MTLEMKKEMIEYMIRLGMDFHTACLASELTEDEEDEVMDDEKFQRIIAVNTALLEKDLLERHDSASKIGELRGSCSGLQWKLEKINPKRYGNKEKDGDVFPTKLVLNMIRGKGKEDNEAE